MRGCAASSISRLSRFLVGAALPAGHAGVMDTAMRLGADVVGGLDPCAIDRDPKGHLDAVFGLCQRYGKVLDIHLHEPGEIGAFSMELIFERTRALGMQGKVTVRCHAFCLGMPDPTLVDPLIEQLAVLDIAIMTTAPASRPTPPVKRLWEAGIRVCAGSDGVRDMWGPSREWRHAGACHAAGPAEQFPPR